MNGHHGSGRLAGAPDGRGRPRRWRAVAGALATMLAVLPNMPAHAEVSPQDGYGPDGAYQVHVELDGAAWIAGTRGDVKLDGGAEVPVGQGVPPLSQLANDLTGAFVGSALLRYGPWSAVLNADHVGLTRVTGLSPTAYGLSRYLTLSRTLTTDSTMARVAPGIGYQVFNGLAGPLPMTLDVQAGLAWLGTSEALTLRVTAPLGYSRSIGTSGGGGLLQPWTGLRADLYPAPRWRITLGAMAQGFGVDGGVWGWGADATLTWAATRWLNLFAGFHALESEDNYPKGKAVQSVRLTELGPLFGIGLTF